MSSRRRQGLTPSLFPFLAVLVCTLGTLILLLALVAQNATDSAEQTARAKTQTETPPQSKGPTAKAVESLLEEDRFRVTKLVSFRDKQTADLENRRDELSHIEEHLKSTRNRLKELNDEVALLVDDTQDMTDIDQQMLTTVRQQLDSEKKSIAELREEAKNKSPRIVIVPHKGPNGTDRRPIYLECNDEGLTIMPEGCQITIEQLENSIDSANPLDSALRIIRLHAMRQYGDTAPPYPLLVVRPDGIEAYGAARGAMQDWDDQFGYELVSGNVKLAFDRPDPGLRKKIDLAIRESSSLQQTIRSLARSGGGGGRGSNGNARGPTAIRQGKGRLPTLSAASLDRAGRANGFRSHRDDINPEGAASQKDLYQRGSRYNDRSYAAPSYGGKPYAIAPGNTDAGDDARQWAAKIRSATNEMKEVSKNQRDLQNGSPLLAQNSPSNSLTSSSNPQGDSAQTTDKNSPGDQQNKFAISSTNTGNTPAGLANPNGSASQPASNEHVPNNAHKSALDQGGNHTSSQIAQSGTKGNGGAMRSGTQSGQSPPSQSNSGSGSTSSDRQGTPQVRAEGDPRTPLRRKGENWALPSRMAGIQGNAIVRSIHVECHSDHFILLAPGTGGATEIFGFTNGNVERATMQLAAAIRDRVSRWGPALPGGRWEPQLDVIVMPGSEARFYDIQSWLRGSGVEVTGRNSL
jgi:hypothetical protein